MTHTPEEAHRLGLPFTPEHVELMLDALDQAESGGDALVYVQEARGSFPKEDCLHDHISALQALAKHVRGENREELKKIIANLEERQSELGRDAEYGLEQLTLAGRALGESTAKKGN
jgi:hypothetical protein